jgi:hypothetical protein
MTLPQESGDALAGRLAHPVRPVNGAIPGGELCLQRRPLGGVGHFGWRIALAATVGNGGTITSAFASSTCARSQIFLAECAEAACKYGASRRHLVRRLDAPPVSLLSVQRCWAG